MGPLKIIRLHNMYTVRLVCNPVTFPRQYFSSVLEPTPMGDTHHPSTQGVLDPSQPGNARHANRYSPATHEQTPSQAQRRDATDHYVQPPQHGRGEFSTQHSRGHTGQSQGSRYMHAPIPQENLGIGQEGDLHLRNTSEDPGRQRSRHSSRDDRRLGPRATAGES